MFVAMYFDKNAQCGAKLNNICEDVDGLHEEMQISRQLWHPNVSVNKTSMSLSKGYVEQGYACVHAGVLFQVCVCGFQSGDAKNDDCHDEDAVTCDDDDDDYDDEDDDADDDANDDDEVDS